MPIKHSGKTPKQQLKEAQQLRKKLPAIAGREAVNFAKDRFRFGGWVDTAFIKWKPRNPDKRKGAAVLLKSRRLRDSIHVSDTSENSITITANMPYAQAHNEGFKGTVAQNVKAHRRKVKSRNTYTKYKTETGKTKREKQSSGVAFVKAFTRVLNMNLPQRQFMGDSRFFMKRLNAIFENRIKQIER